ncbi:MAG: hypothetical protein ACTSWJ_00265 [Candidatus Heimdallarchaeaceae archaeon]
MNKKLITILSLIILTTSSFSMLTVNAAPGDIGFMKIELKDVNIIDDHDGVLLGTGEIYFKFNMNGSELRTANYDGIDNGDNVTLNFVLFESLVKEGSDFFLFIEVWEEDDADADDYVGEYNFTLLPLVFGDFISSYGYSEVFVVTATDATFYLEVTVDDTPTIPPEVDETPYITVTLTSAIIHNKHEATGKGDGEIYFSYEVNEVKTSTLEYKDIEDGETIVANLDLYKGPLLDDEFQFKIVCWEADIDWDDELGGVIFDFPVFDPEWYRANYGNSHTEIIAISDVTFYIDIIVNYPAVPSEYEIIPLDDEVVIYFDTSRDAQVTIHYGTSQGSLVNTLSMIGFRTSHSASIVNLIPFQKYYFKVETLSLDGMMWSDDNCGSMYSFETIDDLPIYSKVTTNLGLEEYYTQELSGGVSFVDFSIGMFAGMYVPLLFSQTTPKYLIPGNSVSSEVTISPEEGFVGAEVTGEVSVYGYKLQLFEPVSYFYNFITPYGDLTLYSFGYSYTLGTLNRSDGIYSVDLSASVDVLFEVGIYLETNVTIDFDGPVDDGTQTSYVIDEGQETKIHEDTVSVSASDGEEVICNANATLQFNNLYFRIASVNLSVVGEVDTIIASDTVDFSYEVVGEGALFEPITLPVLNDWLFPVVLKHDYLHTASEVDAVNPDISSIVDTKNTDTGYTLETVVTDNNAVWVVIASVSIDGAAEQDYLMAHVLGDTYEVSLNIPQGSSADITIVARDVAGRIVSSLIYQIVNPAVIPEMSNCVIVPLFLLTSIVIIPILLKSKKQRI